MTSSNQSGQFVQSNSTQYPEIGLWRTDRQSFYVIFWNSAKPISTWIRKCQADDDWLCAKKENMKKVVVEHPLGTKFISLCIYLLIQSHLLWSQVSSFKLAKKKQKLLTLETDFFKHNAF